MSRIDVHAHIVPPVFRQALVDAGGDPAGWIIPEWTVEDAMKIQDRLSVKASVLSVTSPGCLFLDKEGNRKLARACNEFSSQVKTSNPSRFGFYANLPNPWQDMEGSLTEIKHAFEVLGAEGVCLFTQYNGYYLGHSHFDPLWKELNRLKTSVIIHPTPPDNYKPMPEQKYCPCPAFDFPHETTRTVSDIIFSGTKKRYPDVSIVLCHGGGTIPFLAERIAQTTASPALKSPFSPAEVIEQFKTFYFDTALCGSDPQFSLTAAFVPADRLVYGTDHPYAVRAAMLFFSDELDKRKWEGEEGRRVKMDSDNASKLFPRLA